MTTRRLAPPAAASAYHRDPVTWGCFGALFAFGFLNAALGPALPFLRGELGLSYLTSALHQVAFAAGLVGAGVAGLGLGFGPVVVVTLVAAYLTSACATSGSGSLSRSSP